MTAWRRSLSPVMEEVSAFGVCGPAAKTTRARQTARTAQAQRGGGRAAAEPARSDGSQGRERLRCSWSQVATGTLAGMIQPPG